MESFDSKAENYPKARQATIIGGVVNLILSALKILVGIVGQSQALVADGVHSLSDLISDIMVLYAAKQGGQEADEDHPYGHERLETLATIGVGVLLIAVAIGISIDATERLFNPEQLSNPTVVVLIVAILSIFSKEGIYRYTLKVADDINSNLLRANAWHHRSDALSSVVVLVGVIGTMAGLEYLDAIAAIGVSIMVAKAGAELVWESSQELVDSALSGPEVEEIKKEISSVEGVCSIHLLRTRRMGTKALVDVHVMVDPRLSVSEGHHIADRVAAQLTDKIKDVEDVTVHIDPENDEESAPSLQLPLRSELSEHIKLCLSPIPESRWIDNMTIHYLNGEMELDLWIPLDKMDSSSHMQSVTTELKRCLADDPQISKIRAVYF